MTIVNRCLAAVAATLLLAAAPAAAPSAATAAVPALPQEAGGAALKVVATVPTYGALAREIGGDLVEVVVLCRPGQDMHSVTATPAVVGRVRGAGLVLHTGLDGEPWLQPLLRGAGNSLVVGDARRFVSLSDGLRLKEVPADVSRRAGDVHAFGNTHLWTDPLAVRRMAERVRDALVDLLPAHRDALTARHAAFHDRLTHAMVRWLTDYAPLKGRRLVTHHRSWIYFLDRFGLRRAGTIEPKPRVTPGVGHLEELIGLMREQQVRVIVREPHHHPDAAAFVAEATGATVVELSTHPGHPGDGDGLVGRDVIAHFDHNLAVLARALGLEARGDS